MNCSFHGVCAGTELCCESFDGWQGCAGLLGFATKGMTVLFVDLPEFPAGAHNVRVKPSMVRQLFSIKQRFNF